MVPDPRRVKALFIAARRLPLGARDRLLDESGADPGVRHRVAELLAAYDAAADVPSRHPDERPTPADGPTECGEPGTRFGPYTLVRLIGEGGMGAVWAADQDEPLRRTVALKVIKPGMDSAQVLGRFETERQALARMDHPHIARILDAGRTPAGRPFFVMELVGGDAITRHAARVRASVRARLELFVQVCRAVQHAHQKGVIHRDLKPSNVLVTEVDGRAVAKVIDFGIAKAVDPGPGDGGTAAGGGTLGTPEYMAPEQTASGAPDVDTRADVYALGALLYELLVGTPPLGPRAREPLAVTFRRVREEVPPRPSVRLAALPAGERRAVAAARATDPERLHADLRRELDWLVARALEKEPDRRYPSVADLAADVERYLNDEPVSARPPSRWYRGRKFVRKHRGAVAAAGLIGLAVVGGAAAATVGFLRARAAEREAVAGEVREAGLRKTAEEETARALRSAAELRELLAHTRYLFGAGRPAGVRGGLGRDVPHSKVIEAAEQRLATTRPEPRVEARLRQYLGQNYFAFGKPAKAEGQLRIAARLDAEHPPDDPADALLVRLDLAGVILQGGRTSEAIGLYERVAADVDVELGPGHVLFVASKTALAVAYDLAGRSAEAIALFEVVVPICVRHDPRHPETIYARTMLALANSRAGRYTDALRAAEGLTGPGHDLDDLGSLNAQCVVATIHLRAGNAERAAEMLRRALPHVHKKVGPDHADALAVEAALAGADLARGQPADAVKRLEDVIPRWTRVLGPDHPDIWRAKVDLARGLGKTGRAGRGIELLEPIVPKLRDKLGAGHPDTLAASGALAELFGRAGRHAEAVEVRETLVAGLRTRFGPKSKSTTRAMFDLAETYAAAGRNEKAKATALGVLAITRELTADPQTRAADLVVTGRLLLRIGEDAAAEPLFREVRSLADGAPAGHWAKGAAEALVGRALLGLGRFAEAEPLLLSGHRGLAGHKVPADAWTQPAEAGEWVVRLYDAWGKPAEARAWRDKLGLPPREILPPPRVVGR